MPRFRRISAVSITVAIAALCFWVLAALSAWAYIDPRGMAIEVGIGTALSVMAVNFWRDRRRDRLDLERARLDEDRTILIKTLADVVPARPAARPRAVTGPFPRAL